MCVCGWISSPQTIEIASETMLTINAFRLGLIEIASQDPGSRIHASHPRIIIARNTPFPPTTRGTAYPLRWDMSTRAWLSYPILIPAVPVVSARLLLTIIIIIIISYYYFPRFIRWYNLSDRLSPLNVRRSTVPVLLVLAAEVVAVLAGRYRPINCRPLKHPPSTIHHPSSIPLPLAWARYKHTKYLGSTHIQAR